MSASLFSNMCKTVLYRLFSVIPVFYLSAYSSICSSQFFLLKHGALKLRKVSQLQEFLQGCPKLNCITIVNVTNHMIQNNMIHKIPSF